HARVGVVARALNLTKGQAEASMRKAAGYFATFMSVALLLLATSGANPAYVGGDKSPPGNNGTVKIVNDHGDGQDEPDNDPHVCVLHIYGFNFNSNYIDDSH